jgi:tetratricopeptide (TPR) repeat protein
MVLLKILIPTLLVILTAVQLIRDWKYHDKRTRRYRQVTRAILIAYIIPVLLSAITLYIDSRESSRTQEKIDELVTGKNDLLTKNSELLTQIGKYQSDLQAKEGQIRQLEEKAKMASRGVSSSYDFNGAKRETAGGRISVTAGQEVVVFQRMVELERNKSYLELMTLCKQQIKKTPDWLTPYLYLGVAYVNLGDRSKAITNFEQVVRNAPGDPNYAQAKEFLKQLRNQ